MHRRNKGSARIMFAGFGLLSLVVVMAIMLTMGKESAKTSIDAKRQAEQQINEIQDALDAKGRQIDEAMGNSGGAGRPEGSYSVIVEAVGRRAREVATTVGKLAGITSAEAKRLLSSPPVPVAVGLTHSRANQIKTRIERLGATVRIDKQKD